MRTLGATNLVLLVGIVMLIIVQMCATFPAPNYPERVREGENEGARQPSPERSRRGVCENKGKICEVICKNNPSEGGKFCNCDTYALRAQQPSFADCNRLI